MIEMTVSEARARLADVVDEARVGHEPVFLTRRGRRIAAVIDADQLLRLIEAVELAISDPTSAGTTAVTAGPDGYRGRHAL